MATKKTMSKSDLIIDICNRTGLTKKQVKDVLDTLVDVMRQELTTAGEFNLLNCLKIQTLVKPAKPAGERPNPFKPGEMMQVKAKPAKTVLKVRPLKPLKEAI